MLITFLNNQYNLFSMYQLKQIPEDFLVREISSILPEKSGSYLYFRLTKKLRNTLDVIKEIARQLHLREKDIGFAGSKDKHAVTEQVISLAHAGKEKVLSLKIDNASFEFLGCGNKPISLGDLDGNYFEITIRNLEAKKYSLEKAEWAENYFDEQRFSRQNAAVGRHLLKKEFKQAAELINDDNFKGHLQKHQNDFVGALKILPIRMLRMYLNAYQSYLWNEAVAQYLKHNGNVVKEIGYSAGKLVFISNPKKFSGLQMPLIGFGTADLNLEPEIKAIISYLLEKEKLSYSDFIIRQIPELTLEGEMRPVFIKINNLEIDKEEKDELNPGKKKINISFSLPKGSYATMAVKKIMTEKEN